MDRLGILYRICSRYGDFFYACSYFVAKVALSGHFWRWSGTNKNESLENHPLTYISGSERGLAIEQRVVAQIDATAV
jgi:hypothetical protein